MVYLWHNFCRDVDCKHKHMVEARSYNHNSMARIMFAKGRNSAVHGSFNRIRQMAQMCTPQPLSYIFYGVTATAHYYSPENAVGMVA